MKRECRTNTADAIEVREEAGQPSVLKGYASIFGSRTTIETWSGVFTEAVRAGTFARALREQQDVRSLFNHSADYPLGRTKNGTLVLREDARGLWTETTLPNTQQARDILENVRIGNVTGMSFAFQIRKQEWTRGKEGALDHREIVDVDLFDIAVVTYPAYSDTSVAARATGEIYQEVRSAWTKETEEPVVVETPKLSCGISPEVIFVRASVLRRRFAA